MYLVPILYTIFQFGPYHFNYVNLVSNLLVLSQFSSSHYFGKKIDDVSNDKNKKISFR